MLWGKGADEMKIGTKLKTARARAALTQESVAETLQVSRQTISNWENERSYPDIISVIAISDLYKVSLDELLKGDAEMIEHLDQSTNVVSSSRRLLLAVGVNILLLILFVVFNGLIAENAALIAGGACVGILSVCALFYQIIKKI